MDLTETLQGIRVLDLSRLLPGPFCTAILRAFGAFVTKLEDPYQGDWAKTVPPLYGGLNLTYTNLNYGKEVIVLDLKSKSGLEQFWEFARSSDVLVESFRPGVVKRLGIDYEAVKRENRRIVYLSMSAFGQEGPYARRPGHDLNCLALSGLLDLNRDVRGTPVVPGVQISDISVSLWGIIAVLLALKRREQTGTGCHLDLSMLSCTLPWLVPHVHRLLGGPVAGEDFVRFLMGDLACYGVYATADGGFVALGALEPHHWQEICLKLDKKQWIGWQFATEKQEEIKAELAAVFRGDTREKWLGFFGENAACSPLLTLEEVGANPVVERTGVLQKVDEVQEGGVYQIRWSACIKARE